VAAERQTTHTPFRLTEPRFIAIAASLFVTAMGANAFAQFTIPYLVGVRGWPVADATWALVIAFGAMPALRVAYAAVSQAVGDYWTLLLGNVSYLALIAILLLGSGPLGICGVGLSLGFGSALVFMAGPVQIMELASGGRAGWASGAFFATNFLAWLIAIPAYGAVFQVFGLAAGPYAAAAVTVAGTAACAAFGPRSSGPRPPVEWVQVVTLLSRPAIRSLAALMFISSLSFGFMFGTFATFVTGLYGAATMSFVAFAFYAVRLPASVLAGVTTDRIGPNLTLIATFAISATVLGWSAWHFDLRALVFAIAALGLVQAAVPVVGMSTVTADVPAVARRLAFAPVMGAAEFGVGLTLAVGLPLGTVRPDPAPFLYVVAGVYLMSLVVLVLFRPLIFNSRSHMPQQ
jgi:hypothetical protein